LGLDRDDHVDAFGVLLDLVRETTTAPDINLLDGSTVGTDDVEVLVERRLDRALFETGVEDDHHFIFTQSGLHLLWTQAAADFPRQEGLRSRSGSTGRTGRGPPRSSHGGGARRTGAGYQRRRPGAESLPAPRLTP